MRLKPRTIFWFCAAGLGIIITLILLPLDIGSHLDGGPLPRTQITLTAWQGALDAYRSDCAEYPSDAQGLQALLVNPGVKGWGGPYCKAESIGADLKDGWGTQIKYFASAAGPIVMSAGPDKVFGTTDDMAETNRAFQAGNSANRDER